MEAKRFDIFWIEERDLGIPLINSLPFIPSRIGCLKCKNPFPIDFITQYFLDPISK